MKIEAVRTHLLDHPLSVPFESASGRFERRTHCLVEVVCEDGAVGWGECLGPARLNAAVVQAYAPRLQGRNPLETEKIWLDLYNFLRDQGQRGLAVTGLGGIDVALWDLKGKRFGQPISMLLGGRFREEARAYATGGFRPAGVDRVEAMAAETGTYARDGFSAVKIKIGFDVEEDLKVIEAVRAAIGADTRLMIDANHGYDPLEAIELGRRAAKFDIDWFEEPVLPELLDGYRAVRAQQPIPVAAGETWHTRYAMREPLAQRAVDIIQPNVLGVGGFTEIRRVADLASLHGVRCQPHCWGTGISIAACLQFLSALPHDPPRPEPRAPMLEFDQTENPFRQAVLAQPILHKGGVVAVPDGPGLGVEVNRDALAAYALKAE
ncbi:MAG: mandelate racemase/muconate lactonizing enzyme family protein [Neomegalonema sp.]|nr:mandelate racemase/muconate lactonizing enzyme family protein [Neomegalonema sp.]